MIVMMCFQYSMEFKDEARALSVPCVDGYNSRTFNRYLHYVLSGDQVYIPDNSNTQ